MVQCEQPAPSTSNSATGCGIMKHLCSKSSHQTSDVDSGTISTASHHPAWWLDDLSLYARAWYVLPCPMAYIRCECSHLTHYAIANGIYQKLGESWVSHPYMPCDMVWMSATPLWYHVGIHSGRYNIIIIPSRAFFSCRAPCDAKIGRSSWLC